MNAQAGKYLAVADTLKREILNGKYESHERFPSEGALASLLQRIRNPGLATRAILLGTQMVVRSSC